MAVVRLLRQGADFGNQFGATNLALNPAGKNNTTSWSQANGTLTRVTTDGDRNGTSVQMDITGTGQAVLYPMGTGSASIPVTPGDLVLVRGSVKRVAEPGAWTGVPQLRWRTYDASLVAGAITTVNALTVHPATDNVWERLSFLVLIPPGAAWLSAHMFMQGATAAVVYSARLTDVSIVKNPLHFGLLNTEPMDALPQTLGWVTNTNGSVAGFITQGSGVWSPFDTSAHGMVQPGWGAQANGRLTLRFRTGATALTALRVLFRCATGFTNDYLRTEILADRIRIAKVVSNTATTLTTGTTGFSLANNTDHTLRATFYDDKITGTVWQGDPDAGGTLLGVVSWVLTAAEAASFTSGYLGFAYTATADMQFYDLRFEAPSNVIPPYIDGDQPKMLWNGTAHASTSRQI